MVIRKGKRASAACAVCDLEVIVWVIVWVNVEGDSPPGRFRVGGVSCWDSASLETRCDERPNDHLLLFVSESTKQHLFLRACLEFVVMDGFLKLLRWRLGSIFTARVIFYDLHVIGKTMK